MTGISIVGKPENGKSIKSINVDVAKRDFKYYIFDWDDNILHMPTRVYLDHLDDDGVWRETSVSTSTFALVRSDTAHYRLPLVGGYERAFCDFADSPNVAQQDLAFIRDTGVALDKIASGDMPGPSFETLRKTLREGRIFAIVTARGHDPSTIREAVKLFIKRVLTDAEREEMLANLRGYRYCFDKALPFASDTEELEFYLSLCRYHAVTNPAFKERIVDDTEFGPRFADALPNGGGTSVAKEFAIREFVEHLFRTLRRSGSMLAAHEISVGFSDDDVANVKAVSRYIHAELVRLYPTCKFVVYDTSDITLAHGRKVVVSGQLELN